VIKGMAVGSDLSVDNTKLPPMNRPDPQDDVQPARTAGACVGAFTGAGGQQALYQRREPAPGRIDGTLQPPT